MKKPNKVYNVNSSIIRQRKIRQRIDADRFEMEDFWKVCPYSLNELNSKNRKRELVAWRYTAYAWSMVNMKCVSRVGRYFEKKHCSVLHGLDQLELALDGFGNREIIKAIKTVAAESKKGLPISRKIPFSEYLQFLKQQLPEMENIEEKARQSFQYLPTVLIGHEPQK